MRYELITDELVSKSLPIILAGIQTYFITSVWLIGDFDSLGQFTSLLNVMREADLSCKYKNKHSAFWNDLKYY